MVITLGDIGPLTGTFDEATVFYCLEMVNSLTYEVEVCKLTNLTTSKLLQYT